MAKTWFITGVSRGFGKALAEVVMRNGDRVIGTVRNNGGSSEIETIELDVTDAAAVRRGIDEAWKRAGTIDVVVNNAGYGVLGAIEEVDDASVRRVFETNVFGLLEVTRAALPRLRAQGHGHIFNFSSVGGFVGIAGYGIYNATKFAVEGLSEALRQELAPLGISVTIIEPGPYRTDFLESSSLDDAGNRIDAYDASVGATRRAAGERRGKQIGDPYRAAEVIYRVANEPEPPLRLVLGDPAMQLARKKLAAVEADIARWEEASRETAFPDPALAHSS